MKVRGKVKLLCESCKKVIVRLTRDKHYVYVTCTKNPRHKQRTKYASFSTMTQEECSPLQAACTACQQQEQRQQRADFLPTLTSPSFWGLLAQRHTASIGEMLWRSTPRH